MDYILSYSLADVTFCGIIYLYYGTYRNLTSSKTVCHYIYIYASRIFMVSFIYYIYITMGGYTVKIDAPPRAIQHIKDGRSWHNVRKKNR